MPIQQYCPQYPRKEWPITTRLLLSHLTSIRHYHGANGEPRDTEEQRRSLNKLIEREQATQYTRYTEITNALDVFKGDPLRFPPGTDFLYTSLGYRVLACVLEGAAETPYRLLMRRLIFEPAGMTAITEDDTMTIIPWRVAGYARGPDNALVRAPFRDISENLPAGGHIATAEDLVRFAAAFNSGKLVRTDTRDRMTSRPALVGGSNAPELPLFFGVGPGLFYGMGIFVGSTANGEKLLMHNGRQPGTSTQLLLLSESDTAVAAMANISGWNGVDGLVRELARLAAEEE